METQQALTMTSVQYPRILCCKCGVSMESNETNICVPCLSTEVDIAKYIPRQNTIIFCTKCERYLNPPSQWVSVDPESPELLSMCIKRVRGLSKGLTVRGAKFIWTEPHSRRINIEVTVHGELPTGDLVEQEIPLEFIVHPQQCSDCARLAAKDYWSACVQLRQHVERRKTLFHLEQIIHRCNAHKECTNIKQVHEGIDFYFSTRSQAVSFMNFICKRAPCRTQTSQHLKSHDVHNNTYNYKFTFSVEVVGVCKNDIVCLSKAQSQRLGGIGPLCIVTKVSEAIHLIDPVTCQVSQVDGATYFASPFTAITSQSQLRSFVVVEIEESKRGAMEEKLPVPVGARLSKRHRAVSLWLMRLNQDLTVAGGQVDSNEDGMMHARSHLGHILREGDTVNGLDLRRCNINHPEFEKLPQHHVPDVILVSRPPQPHDDDTSGRVTHRATSRNRKRKHSMDTAEAASWVTETDSQPDVSDEFESDDEFVDCE